MSVHSLVNLEVLKKWLFFVVLFCFFKQEPETRGIPKRTKTAAEQVQVTLKLKV